MDSNTLFLGGSKYVIDDNGLISICRRPSTVSRWSTMMKSDLPAPLEACHLIFVLDYFP